MARVSPLREQHLAEETPSLHYGPAEADLLVVEAFEEVELEYAALRKRCVLFDAPLRGTLVATGADRLTFLNSMLTQQLKTLEPFRCTDSFWLNRKGRIDADLRVVHLPDRTILDVDALASAHACETLNAFIFGEDVELKDESESLHRLCLHGQTALSVFAQVARSVSGPSVAELEPNQACVVSIGEHEVVVDRDDLTGEVGLNLTMPVAAVSDVWSIIVALNPVYDPVPGVPPPPPVVRPCGWHAINVARIENGRPLFNIDFGSESLPHETSLVEARVSFNKGCFLGQEIVARMQSRASVKQRLVALKLTGGNVRDEQGVPRQPVTGTNITTEPEPGADIIGGVTSSTVSPMLSATPVCFAMVKSKHAEAGATLFLPAEGAIVEATVQPALRFWSRSG